MECLAVRGREYRLKQQFHMSTIHSEYPDIEKYHYNFHLQLNVIMFTLYTGTAAAE